MIGRRPFIVAMIADPLLSNVAPMGPRRPTQARPRAIVLGIEMMLQFCLNQRDCFTTDVDREGYLPEPPMQEDHRRCFPSRFRASLDGDSHIGIGQHG